MDLLQEFVFNNSRHEVNITWQDGKPFFRASEISKVLGLKNIRDAIKDFDEDEKVKRQTDTLGGTQDILYLTEAGMYKVIMRSNKPIAKPFQKWVIQVIISIREQGRYDLQEEIDNLRRKNESLSLHVDANLRESNAKISALESKATEANALYKQFKDEEDIRNHNTLVIGSEARPLVYFAEIKTLPDGEEGEPGKILLKIGNTDNLKDRAHRLRQEYGPTIIRNRFDCLMNEAFEKFLLQHVDIKRYRYQGRVSKIHQTSTEVFAMTQGQFERAVNIATRNVSQYRVERHRDIDDAIEMNPIIIAMKAQLHELSGGSNPDEEVEGDVLPVLGSKRGFETIGKVGCKIQRYSADLELQETYNTIRSALDDRKLTKGSEAGIRDSSNNNTEYNGFRWKLLGREMPDDTVQELEPTVETKKQRTGPVVALNLEKTKILDVYSGMKACAVAHNFKQGGGITKRLARGLDVDGKHIEYWANLSDAMQQEYLKDGKLPANPIPHQKPVERLDAKTKKVLHTYSTMQEVIEKFKMTSRTLNKFIISGNAKHGFCWRYADTQET